MVVSKFLLFLLKNILIIHKGALLAKIKASFVLSFIISPVALLVEKLTNWYVSNNDYIHWVLWAIFVDWFIGQILHVFYKKDFSWGKMGKGLIVKVAMAVLAGSLFEALPYFLNGQQLVADSLLIVTRLSVFMYPAASAWANCSEITGGKFPPIGWTKKLKAFNENLDFKSPDQKSDNI